MSVVNYFDIGSLVSPSMHEGILNHDNIHTLVYTLLGLHIVCWTSVYYVSLKYKLVCVLELLFMLFIIDSIPLPVHINSVWARSFAGDSRFPFTANGDSHRCDLVFAVNLFETSIEDKVSASTLVHF
jgi:hypothetical protein